MSSAANYVLDRLLKEAGFERNNIYAEGIINAQNVKDLPNTYLRYNDLLARIQQDFAGSNFIYEISSHSEDVPGTPCIYFVTIDGPTPQIVNEIRTRIWNHGRIPTLWIISSDSVRVYDSFARPRARDEDNLDSHQLDELRYVKEKLEGIEKYHRNYFDTGEFWKTGQGRKIDPNQRVDSSLLSDLSDTENTLVIEQSLPPAVAHSLLGRTIFVKYLEDRKILRPVHYSPDGNYREFKELLNDKPKTYAFFEWLHTMFNGDLFPLEPQEQQIVTKSHLETLWRFLSGYDMKIMQARFWPYSFDIIPIELISSIYEMFATSIDPQLAKAMSIHYTRFGLVELVLSLAMQGMKDTAKVLDPACGSGVFLVEAFRRLVWLREKRYGRPLDRKELRDLLRSQIFGMDIDKNAMYIAAFSLYLALLELDPERHPEPLDTLRFPPLLSHKTSNKQASNLYVQDFFNTEHAFNSIPPFSNGKFDLIVSNPPWTALKKDTAPRDPDNPQSGERWGLKYCEEQGVPDNKIDQAFMWRARDFAKPETRIALIAGSRLLYQASDKGQRWRREFLKSNRIAQAVNLSDLVQENLLFGGRSTATRRSSTRMPASVFIFSCTEPSSDHLIRYIAPKWYPGIRGRDELIISTKDIQLLPQELLRDHDFLWKTAFRGTPRDFQFVRRLQEYQSLDKVLLNLGILDRTGRVVGLSFGRNPTKDASELRGLPFLTSASARRYSIDVNILDRFERPFVAQKSNMKALKLPVLVLSGTLLENMPCVALLEQVGAHDKIVFDKRYYGISFHSAGYEFAHRLNAILNSKLALYMIFMTGSELGWYRRTIEPNDWKQVAIPESIYEGSGDAWKRVLELEQQLNTNWQAGPASSVQRKITEVENQLDQEIYLLYDLSEQEIVLVEDTTRYTIHPLLDRYTGKPIEALQKPTPDLLLTYARRLCSQINKILYTSGLELSALVFPVENAPLSACRFTVREPSSSSPVSESRLRDEEELLQQISEKLRKKVADHLYVRRDLRIYDDGTFWIIKPAESQLWSETAALNDADIVVSEHMEASA